MREGGGCETSCMLTPSGLVPSDFTGVLLDKQQVELALTEPVRQN